MTGTPHSDVTALSGMSVPLVGRQHIRLHAPATAAPMNIERGRSTRWFDVRETKRAIWGTASPRKATGPHNDVGTAVKGICDKVYARSRPKSVDDRPNSYIVVSFPSMIFNNEMNSDGSFNDYSTTAQIEIYVRDKVTPKNPSSLDVSTVDTKVSKVLGQFPIITDHLVLTKPRVTMQADDGDGFSVTIVQGMLRTR